MHYSQIHSFMIESNYIEGIYNTSPLEVKATAEFLESPRPTVNLLKALVSVYQPNARIRDMPGLNVRVGSHIPPPGGPKIITSLEALLDCVANNDVTPFAAHCRYETLHPFTDGNGRSGRALWLWHMAHNRDPLVNDLGFLHAWYYQSFNENGIWHAEGVL